MKNLRERVLHGENLLGTWLNIGSSLTAEIVGKAGFDWTLIDLEHGCGTEADVLHQVQALESTPAAAVVRVESHARQRVHRMLDLGAHGIMFPRVNTVAEARDAVATMRYPPEGVRGMAIMNRACEFGATHKEYLAAANSTLLTIVQIETAEAVENVEAIAAVEGVDVLFIGPWDLSHSLGITAQFDQPLFQEAIRRTAQAAAAQGKMAGILLQKPGDVDHYLTAGYRFLACGSDGGLVYNGARTLAGTLREALAKRA
jgi:4-hydroxy-2-oxoheptanedioate aldolase